MNYVVKTLRVFEFGSWQEATSKAGKAPTTTKWIDQVKKDGDGCEFVRRRLVARDFKTTSRGSEGRLVRGDATSGRKEGRCLHTLQGCAKETRTRSGRSDAHVHRREESALEREM